MTTLRRIIQRALLAGAAALAMHGAAMADLVRMKVVLDTSALIGQGPFSVAFQLVDGDGIGGNNTVTLDTFEFGGGSAGAGPDLYGGATGSLQTGASLTDSDPFFNAFVQSFTAGSTLSFGLTLTNVGGGGGFDDLFAFSLLDGNGMGIATLDPMGFDTFVTFTMTGGSLPLVQSSGSDLSRTTYDLPAPVVVPEPSAVALLLASLGALLLAGRRRTAGRPEGRSWGAAQPA